MRRLTALDLYCGAGGASMGLHRAGFEVTGIDIDIKALRGHCHPGRVVLADALNPPVDLRAFDLIWASPPCQRFTVALNKRKHLRTRHPDLIAPTRAMLDQAGVPYVIENVPGAPIRPDVVLDGAMFDLGVVRRRYFEISGFTPPFRFSVGRTATTLNGDLAVVAGGGCSRFYGKVKDPEQHERIRRRNLVAGWRTAMGIDWMTKKTLSQAVPPAYASYIGEQAMAELRG